MDRVTGEVGTVSDLDDGVVPKPLLLTVATRAHIFSKTRTGCDEAGQAVVLLSSPEIQPTPRGGVTRPTWLVLENVRDGPLACSPLGAAFSSGRITGALRP